MAVDPKKRQRKLERRAAKRKQRHRTLVKQRNRGLAELLGAACRAPVLDSYISEAVGRSGFGSVVLSRELPNGQVAVGVFLVDCHCLGVKDAMGNVLTRGEYEGLLETIEKGEDLEEWEPADVRKLVEDAVEYARKLGLEPHADYHRIRPIFGDIDPADSSEVFEFGGDDGKPLFVAGPYDTPERCYRILSILEHTCGPGGFNYIMPLDAADVEGMELEDEDEGEEEQEDDYRPLLPGQWR
jgi:hypothetical protein